MFSMIQVMKDPKILLSRIRVIFDVMCFLLALYMTLKNIERYQQDTNATTITYKKYGYAVGDTYPSFSVCLEGYGIFRFNESAIFITYGIHLSDYQMMLEGKPAYQYEYDPSSQRYSKISLDQIFKPSIGLKVQDVFQLPDIVEKTSFAAVNQSQSIVYGKKETISAERILDDPPLYVSYKSSKLFCLTRNEDRLSSDLIRRHDSVTLNWSSMDSNTYLNNMTKNKIK